MTLRSATTMSWFAIARLGLVNAALGAVVALVTFTLNRVMAVELALPAIVPGALVALHYAVQLLRPGVGFGSDAGRRTPWIVGGLAVLSAGGALAALAVALMAGQPVAGIALAVLAYTLVGAGVAATGTASLALMAIQVAPARRPAAATLFWLLMIFGAVAASAISMKLLHPFSLALLLRVSATIAGAAFLLGTLAVIGVEGPASARVSAAAPTPFRTALAETLREPDSRRFAIFVFISMLAYSAQELILEPFAGAVMALAPAQTAALTGLHQSGVLAGMLLVAVGASLAGAGRAPAMRRWALGGCAGSALCLLGLAAAGLVGPAWPLKPNLFALGLANGAFAVSAIGAMLALAGTGRAGVRMGIWGAAQAVAMGLGGLLSTGASDAARLLLGAPGPAYAFVFCLQAVLFLAAARLASGVLAGSQGLHATSTSHAPTAGAPMGAV